MVIYRLYDGHREVDMQECRNWQTSKTKDLVINAIVWVQVPSSASFQKIFQNAEVSELADEQD